MNPPPTPTPGPCFADPSPPPSVLSGQSPPLPLGHLSPDPPPAPHLASSEWGLPLPLGSPLPQPPLPIPRPRYPRRGASPPWRPFRAELSPPPSPLGVPPLMLAPGSADPTPRPWFSRPHTFLERLLQFRTFLPPPPPYSTSCADPQISSYSASVSFSDPFACSAPHFSLVLPLLC